VVLKRPYLPGAGATLEKSEYYLILRKYLGFNKNWTLSKFNAMSDINYKLR